MYFMPLFFTSGPQTRIAICLFLHPVLLEAGEAVSRSTRGDATALALRKGEIKTYEEAAQQIVEDSLSDSVLKLIMAFYRRFMLLNMGSTQVTMFTVVAASIEEASVTTVHSVLSPRFSLTQPYAFLPLSHRPDSAAS